MKKSDIIASLVIGELIAWFSFGILKNLSSEVEFLFLISEFKWSFWIWIVSFPILTLIGLWIAHLVGKRFLILWQAAKFVLVGVLNTLVDLGILNILGLILGITTGFGFSALKGISFIVAVTNSYFWNKFWTFSSSVPPSGTSDGQAEKSKVGKEFSQFFVVSLIGFGINVGVASLVVIVIGPQFGLSEKIWLNIGAITATFFGMAWNFVGYKFIVFKQHESSPL